MAPPTNNALRYPYTGSVFNILTTSSSIAYYYYSTFILITWHFLILCSFCLVRNLVLLSRKSLFLKENRMVTSIEKNIVVSQGLYMGPIFFDVCNDCFWYRILWRRHMTTESRSKSRARSISSSSGLTTSTLPSSCFPRITLSCVLPG